YTYQWQDSPDGSTWTNISGATADTYQPGALTATTYYQLIVDDGANCGPVTTNTVTITVYDEFLASISADETICYNTVPNLLTSTVSGGDGSYTYQWQDSPDGTTWTNISGATADTYQPGALTATTYYQLIVDDGANCGPVITNTVTITVYDIFLASAAADQTICYDTQPNELTSTVSGGEGTYTYQWQYLDGSTWTNISGANSDTYQPGNLILDTYYQLIVDDGANCGPVTTNTVTITVYDEFLASISADETICYNIVPSLLTSTVSGGDGSYTYQWQDSPDGTTWTNISGATADTYQPGALTATTYYQLIVDDGANCGPVTTNTVTITVYDEFLASIGSDETICYNTAPNMLTSTVSGGDGSYTYQWQTSPNGTNWSNIAGATNATYQPGNLIVTTYYQLIVDDGAGCGPVTTNTVTITVSGDFDEGIIGDDQSICYNDQPATLYFTTAPSGGIGQYYYQWYSSIDNITFNLIGGATNSTYLPPALTQTSYYYCEVENQVCGTKNTNVVTITVYGEFLATVGTSQTICYNTIPAALTSSVSGGDGSYTYQWQESIDGSTWTNISGATSATYQPGALTSTTYFQLIVEDGSSCGPITSTNYITITVYDELIISASTSQSICYNTQPAGLTSVYSGGNGVYTFQWYESIDGTNWSLIAGATGDNYQPPALTTTTYYQIVIEDSWSCGPVTSNTVTITVYGEFLASIDADETICYNTVPSLLTSTVSGGEGTYSYQWMDSPDGTTWSNISGATNATYQPGALTVTTYYQLIVDDGAGCGPITTNSITITVYDEFLAGSIGDDQTICATFTPNCLNFVTAPNGGEGTYTYQWYSSIDNSTFNIITGETNTTYCPPALSTTMYYYCEVTDLCDVLNTNTVTITVDALPPVPQIYGPQNVCEGETGAVYGTVDLGYYYTWIVTGGPGTVIISGQNTNEITVDWGYDQNPGEIWLNVTDGTTTCSIAEYYEVTIHPVPEPVISGNVAVDEYSSAFYSTPNVTGNLYTWTVTGGTLISGQGTNVIEVLWGPAGVGTIVVMETIISTGCMFTTDDYVVTINPTGGYTVSGYLTYDNIYSTELGGVSIILKDGNDATVGTSVTDEFGYYEFNNVDDGIYTFDVSSSLPLGGINATDALAIQLHTIGIITLIDLPLVAADVNNSGTVNASDALYVKYRTIQLISSFPSGDWAFDNIALTVSGANVSYDFMGLCFGDVNRSNVPSGAKSTGFISLLNDGIKSVALNQEFDLPIRVNQNVELGAITLMMSYAEDLIEILGVSTTEEGLEYNIDNGTIRIAWNNTNAMFIEDDKAVVTLRVKAISDISSQDWLFSIEKNSEFADAKAMVIDNITLKTSALETTNLFYSLGNNYPNPYSNNTVIEYSIPETGKVVISITDILGNSISTIVNSTQDAGIHQVTFDGSHLNPGIYIYKMVVDGENSDFIKMKKMTVR
ncbi:MAG: T9SS type A sorting domain-containing protein, partial [Bacteroidales bacterium]|nr:T9SS type A sorting domain-containing protein [Bacteroidales bacterium]